MFNQDRFDKFTNIIKQPDLNNVNTLVYLILHKNCTEIKNVTGKIFEELIDDYSDENIEWDEGESAIILNNSALKSYLVFFKMLID